MSDRQKDGGISVDSEDLSQCSNYESITKGSDGETEGADHSDYGDEGRRDFQPLDSADEEHVDVDENDEENDSDSVIVEDEREDGDGQESVPSKERKLDDDEDRRNPQYIPKKGTFYEHDDRTADDGESGKDRDGKEGGKDREGKEGGKEGTGGSAAGGRKIWKEKEDRWKHDRFLETEQMPKSREELLMVYGYDIRSEESPPKARRRRRYGRGPNKYTRNWEDEEAYGRPLSAFIVDKEGGGDSADAGRPRRKGPPSRGGQAGDGPKSGRPPRKDRPRRQPEAAQDFPALTPAADAEPAENGQKAKPETIQVTFSSKVSGDNPVAAGSFKMNPRDVIAPFRNHEKQQQSQASSNKQQNHPVSSNQSQETQPAEKSGPQTHHQHSIKSEDSNRKSWRRDDGDEEDPRSRRRQMAGRSEGRPRPQSGGVRRRSGDWQDQNGHQAPNRPRGRIGRTVDSARIPRSGENGNQSDGGALNYADDVSRELGTLTITNAQHQRQPSSPQQSSGGPGGDYTRRPNNNAGGSSNGTAPNSSYRQNAVPPRMQESAGSRPKRYSSVRPRNMPEAGPGTGPVPGPSPGPVPVAVPVSVSGTAAPPVPVPVPVNVPVPGTGATPTPTPVTAAYTTPAHSYYQPGYAPAPVQQLYADTGAQQTVANQVVQASAASPLMVRSPGAAMAPPPGALPPPPYPAGFPQPPPTYMAAPPGPTGRLLPATGYMAPAPAPPPQTMNFVPAPAAQGQFQSLAFQPYQQIAMVSQVSQPQPQELYQRQSGITYYSPQNQTVPRAAPQPRVKAAIPIVPPPEMTPRHRGDVAVDHEAVAPSSSPSPQPHPSTSPPAPDVSPSPPAPSQSPHRESSPPAVAPQHHVLPPESASTTPAAESPSNRLADSGADASAVQPA